MDKQQRIEQISNIISNSCCNIEPIHNCTSSCSKCIAENIYNKLFSENTLIMTKETYKRHIKEAMNFSNSLGKAVASDKFMSSISNDVLVVNTKEYGNIEVVPVERLQEIIQTLGVNE